MSSITFHSCHFNLFFCSGPQKLTLRARVNSFLLWSDGTGYREATACITRTCPSRPLWTHWVQRVAPSSLVSPAPPPGHLAAGQPMAKELWRGRRLQVHWPRRLAVELQSGRRWPSTTLRRNRRSPPTFPKSSSSITRPQCACVETKHKRLFPLRFTCPTSSTVLFLSHTWIWVERLWRILSFLNGALYLSLNNFDFSFKRAHSFVFMSKLLPKMMILDIFRITFWVVYLLKLLLK